jgi:hypothetical membrane protein
MAREDTTRRLLASGVIGPTLFVLAFLIEGAIRPAYDPGRVFVSMLSLGDQGWVQVANFLVSGALIVAFAIGLRRVMRWGPGCRWGPILVGGVGFGLVIAGIFAGDPGMGYPPGTPPGPVQSSSWHASVHFIGAIFVFVGLPIASFVFARRFQSDRDPVWALYSLASGLGMFVVFIAASADANGGDPAGVAGWLQRASIVIGFAWIVLLARRFMRESAMAADEEPAISSDG